jgi:putative transposase
MMSYSAIYYHIVYSTNGRRAAFNEAEMARLCEYKAGIIRSLRSKLHIANGPADHIHMVVSLDPSTSLVDFVRTVKASSSKWVHQTFPQLEHFAWQDGYAAFTVSYSGLDKVVAYIQNQREHHKKLSFDEELVQFLQKHGVKYDERYVAGE